MGVQSPDPAICHGRRLAQGAVVLDTDDGGLRRPWGWSMWSSQVPLGEIPLPWCGISSSVPLRAARAWPRWLNPCTQPGKPWSSDARSVVDVGWKTDGLVRAATRLSRQVPCAPGHGGPRGRRRNTRWSRRSGQRALRCLQVLPPRLVLQPVQFTLGPGAEAVAGDVLLEWRDVPADGFSPRAAIF